MKTIIINEPINLRVVKYELNFDLLNTSDKNRKSKVKKPKEIHIPKIEQKKQHTIPAPPPVKSVHKKPDVKELVEKLLDELYTDQREWSRNSVVGYSQSLTTAASIASSHSTCDEQTDAIERIYLEDLGKEELQDQLDELMTRFSAAGERLAKYLRARDRLKREQKKLCAAFTVLLRHITGDSNARFGLAPSGSEGPGEGGFSEWLHAMKLVARLPAGVPQHFRRKLWLTLSERYLSSRGVQWPAAERACFRGTAQPDDTELGAQILKDLHRTGCSLFCGTEGRENQAMLRRVLLAYARWNKDVGYCQGFNMLAAIILEVMEKSESDALKVMIYLVEAVLPEGYFADDLRGLSADMAAFRDLLRLRLPRLAHHMDYLQKISDGGGIEPPLPDVFTMQWFLTLYATWLPRESLLRIWDLILLDGNEVLLLTALAIWDMLQDRILSARSADEFYSCMGGGVGAVWAAGEALVARVVALGPAPELPRLRSLHRYRVAPPAPPAPTSAPIYHPPLQSAVQSMTKRGLRLFYSEDEGDSSDDGNKMALATVIPRREERSGAGDRLSLDIGALKRQYARLRERQRQAHVILAAACARQAAVGVPTSPTSLTVNNLLLGKSAIVSSRGRRLGPPPGAIPPSRASSLNHEKSDAKPRAVANDTISWKEEKSRQSINRRNSLKWKDIKKEKTTHKSRKASIDLDEGGDGVIVSEIEASEMIASLRSRSSSESSTYSSHSASSTDTSLCDENERVSESDQSDDSKGKISATVIHRVQKTTSNPVAKQEAHTQTTAQDAKYPTSTKPVKSINDYLDSDAGKPLRTYIDGFETKSKSAPSCENFSNKLTTTFSPAITLSSHNSSERNDVLQRLTKTSYCENSTSQEFIKPTNLSKSKNFTELSPIDISPCNCDFECISPYGYHFESNFNSSTIELNPRQPDIIDSLTMYPNFVPDIDLSDKNISDFDSPPHSPGEESIIVSEDEPPIPLKIDKYFEHSPEFFGARVTDPNNSDIPNRRATKRQLRQPKKPDSLTLQTNHNEKTLKDDVERASSLPQSQSFRKNETPSPILTPEVKNKFSAENANMNKKITFTDKTPEKPEEKSLKATDVISPKENFVRCGRKNSERALQIIQENSQILSRILTKQNISASQNQTNKNKQESELTNKQENLNPVINEKVTDNKQIESPLLKESTSDSLIGCIKRHPKIESTERNDFQRVRPISIDDPFSLELRNVLSRNEELTVKSNRTPSSECLGNKTDLYGWENKGFLAKCEFKSFSEKPECNYDTFRTKQGNSPIKHNFSQDLKTEESRWTRHSFSGDTKTSVTLPSSNSKDMSPYEHRFTSDDYNYTFSSKYSDLLSRASDICSKTDDKVSKPSENIIKSDNSQVTDFSHVVTSSISFTCEPSIDDESPIGAKSNSSDTLCQITSLDQISTPISPKIFPNRETPTHQNDYTEKSENFRMDSDDTCSAITSLVETETLSSLSYPRSPSTGSYHPFPTRHSTRLPKELGVRLGMYPRETIGSPQK
ncbi:TBC1 domain family member 30 [Papilio machaon]|uniref:TBC1 domain family member 30 n=1 Tax=Papilio machaon TaxID=76193 RepID=A0A194R6D1_PAPMA|nr:TBC1 domain family member 30 [Papilio machaon]